MIKKCILVDFPKFSDYEAFNTVMNEYVNLKEFLNKSNNNICILNLGGHNKYLADVFDLDALKEAAYKNLIYECNSQHGISSFFMDNINTNMLYSRSLLQNSLGIRTKQLLKLTNTGTRVFIITDFKKLDSSTSTEMISFLYPNNIFGERIDVMSGAHCTDGTFIDVYDTILEVDIQSLNEEKTDEEKQRYLDSITENKQTMCNKTTIKN